MSNNEKLDNAELKEKLKSEVEEADWDMLKTHHDNGAVFIISEKIPLLDAAIAVATDKVSFVKLWVDNGDMARPNEKQVEYFSESPFKKICDFIIIQPYVLIQLKETHS